MAVQSDWESKQPDTREVEGKKRSRELGEVNRRCAGCAGAGQSQRGAAPRGGPGHRGGGVSVAMELRCGRAAAAAAAEKKRSVGSAVQGADTRGPGAGWASRPPLCICKTDGAQCGCRVVAIRPQPRTAIQYQQRAGWSISPPSTLKTAFFLSRPSQASEPSGGSPLYPQLAPKCRLRRVRRAGMARWSAGHVRWCNFGVVRPVFLVSSGTTLMKEQKSSPLPGLELHTHTKHVARAIPA